MKRKILIIGMLILLAASGFVLVKDARQETDQDMELARMYAKGYIDGYKAKQQDLEWQVEAWKTRYFYMIDREVERWENE